MERERIEREEDMSSEASEEEDEEDEELEKLLEEQAHFIVRESALQEEEKAGDGREDVAAGRMSMMGGDGPGNVGCSKALFDEMMKKKEEEKAKLKMEHNERRQWVAAISLLLLVSLIG